MGRASLLFLCSVLTVVWSCQPPDCDHPDCGSCGELRHSLLLLRLIIEYACNHWVVKLYRISQAWIEKGMKMLLVALLSVLLTTAWMLTTLSVRGLDAQGV